MRRSDLIAGIDNVLEAFDKSKIYEVIRRSRMNPRDSVPEISPNYFSAFQKYSISCASFGDAEQEVLTRLGLGALALPNTWAEISSGKRTDFIIELSSSLSQAVRFLPKFRNLLEQDYIEEVKSGSVKLPEQLQGKVILTVVLPESHGQFSTAKRVSELIESITLFYECFLEVCQDSQDPLVILSLDSGSDKSIDFLGVAQAMQCIKDIILDIWDRVMFYRADQFSRNLKLVTGESDIFSSLTRLQDNDDLSPEQRAKMQRVLEDTALKFLSTGATIPEMSNQTTFEPRLLMGRAIEPKLLTGTPDPEVTSEIEETTSDLAEIENMAAEEGLTEEKRRELNKILQQAKQLLKSNDSGDEIESIIDGLMI